MSPKRWTRAWAWISVLSLLVVTGCKMQTTRKEEQIKEKAAAEEEGEKAEEENQAAIAELKKEESEIQRKAKEIEAQLARQRRYDEAFSLLGGEPGQALAIVDELFAENEKAIEFKKKVDDAKENDAEIELDFGPDGQPIIYAPPMTTDEQARFLVLKGSAHYKMGEEDSAIEAYAKAFELDPNFRPCRLNLGKLYFQKNLYKKALEVWNVELAAGFRSGELMFLIGQALYEVGKGENNTGSTEAAREAIRAALVERPNDPEVMRWMAVLEFETERWQEAARLFRRILKSHPLDTDYMELLANCYLSLEDYSKAIDTLEAIARLKKADKNICLSLSDLYYQVEMPGRAADWLEKAYESRAATPSKEKVSLGYFRSKSGEKESAIQWLSEIDKDDDGYDEAVQMLPYLYLDLGRSDQAIAALNSALEVHPADGSLWLLDGDLNLEAKSYDRARTAYAKASALPDSKADGYAGLAEVSYAEGNLAEAVKKYQQAIAANPDETRFLYPLRQIQGELEVLGTDTELNSVSVPK